MEKFHKYIIGLLSFVLLILFVIYFGYIIVWILFAAIIAMVCGPIVILLGKIRYKKFKAPDWASALVGITVIWLVIFLFFRISVPLISNQIAEFQSIDVEIISKGLEIPIKNVDDFIQNTPIINEPDFSIENLVIDKISSVLNLSNVRDIFSDLSSLLWNLVLSIFAVTFISFFFLKDRGLFDMGVLAIVPDKYEEKTKSVLVSVRNLISRYLIGIILQSLCMMVLYISGLYIIGVNFNLAVLIGIIAGVLNVIPYIGPWIGAVIAFVLITVGNIQYDFYDITIPLLIKMLVVVASAQIIDNIVFQPIIFGKSVKAHPIEIFLIILIAGSLYGILGMMLAIPSYTVIRVIAKEFFYQYKFVQKITQNITTAENKKNKPKENANI